MTVRARIEAGFASWGRWVVRWRWLVLLAMALLTAALGSQVPQVRVDNSEEAFLHADDPERVRNDRFRAQFGREDRINLILHPPEVFDLGFLEILRRLQREIEDEVPYVEEVTSLINARNTRGEQDELIVEDLMERWPESDSELEALRQRALSNPLFENVLITRDAKYTVLSIKPFTYSSLGSQEDDALSAFEEGEQGAVGEAPYLSEAETLSLVRALARVVAGYESEALPIYQVGGPVMEYALTQTMQRDVALFLGLALVIIMGLLLLLFRRLSGVVMPALVVLGAVVSSMGVMVLLDIPFSVTLNILPAFLLVVGVCDSVHILVIVYQRLDGGSSREDAIAYALGHSGLAVLMTSVTTAAGLMSFVFAELAPIAQLGVIAPVGVMLAMLYSLILLPALLAFVPLRAKSRREGEAVVGVTARLLARVGEVATGRPVLVLLLTGVILAVGLAGVLQVRFSHDAVYWFPEQAPVRVAYELVDREFDGASSLEILVHAPEENGLQQPDTLRRMEQAMRHVETLEIGGRRVGKAMSLVDVVKEIHQALNENRRDFYILPEDRQLIAQELLLFENSGSDDLEDLSDSQFRQGRISVRTAWVDAMLYPKFVEDVRESLPGILGDQLDFELTGGTVLVSRVFRGVIVSMTRSYLFALAVITPLLVLLVGNLRLGLAAMIPNLIPVYLVLGLMGWTDIPLDASTLLIGGIVLGIAVDDTIHFMHKFNRYLEELGDPRAAVRETLVTTGTALLFTSVVLSLGFAVFLASYLQNIFWFGLLTCFATVVAFVADVVVAPALMVLLVRPSRDESTVAAAVAAGVDPGGSS